MLKFSMYIEEKSATMAHWEKKKPLILELLE